MSEREKLIEAMAGAMNELDEIEIPSIAHDGSISADWLAMTLIEDARIENGRLANAEYLAVKIACASDFILSRAVMAEAEIARLKAIPGLSDVLDGKAVIVPVEPTPEMREAATPATEDWIGHESARPDTVQRWRHANARLALKAFAAMLAASPYRSKTDE